MMEKLEKLTVVIGKLSGCARPGGAEPYYVYNACLTPELEPTPTQTWHIFHSKIKIVKWPGFMKLHEI